MSGIQCLTQEERELYSRLFKALDPESSGIVTGEKARTTFEKSGLPANILGEIWQLADVNNLGFLTQFGFCHAMRLIGYTQAGHFPTAQLAETPGPLPKFADLPSPPSQLLRSQSTNGSLLQPQPSSLVPQNTATQQTLPQAPIAPVSPTDYEKFTQIYVKTTGSKMASLDGNSAKSILMKAKLPTVTLGQIWSLVDVNNRGFLDLPSFVMAMHLIHGLLSGTLKQLPPFLPEHVWKSVDFPIGNPSSGDRSVSYSSINSQSSTIRHPPAQQPVRASTTGNVNPPPPSLSEWQVSPLQKQQFDSIFDNLDKSKSGSLASDQVASFLMTSRLDQQDLATIWDLADIQNTGVFSKLEFGIALFLINRRRSGLTLPDVVPEELITSLSQATSSVAQPPQSQPQPQQPQQPHQHVQAPAVRPDPPVQQKSSLDELADIFGSSSPAPVMSTALTAGSPQNTGIQPRSSSSDLSHSHGPPQVRQQLTSSFKPSSSFGQSLLANRTQTSNEPTDLIGEDVSSNKNIENKDYGNSSVAPVYQSSPSNSQVIPESAEAKKRTVDYEALRSVPAPPQTKPITASPLGQNQISTESDLSNAQPVTGIPRALSSQENNDLLADSEVSGKLSEATSDIANFSNQIKSLSTQTSNLHEKKIRAEKELTRILTVKEEINTKLKSLRTSYASEVKQVEQVEMNLNNAKEELEALRSEASIAEAKFNNISNEFHEKQLAVEENQKINSSLREKLGNLNAEIAALESELQSKSSENVRLSNETNVKKSQAQVALVKVDELKNKIAEAESSRGKYLNQIQEFENQRSTAEAQTAELQSKHDGLTKGLSEIQAKHSLLASGVGAAAGLAIGAGAHSLTQATKDIKQGPDHSQSEPTKENVPPTAENQTTLPRVVTDNEAGTLPSGESKKVQSSSLKSEEINPQTDSTSFSVAGMVDEVKQNPAEDLTGLDDIKHVEHKELSFDEEDAEGLKQRFPPVPITYESPGNLTNEYNSSNFHEGISKRASTSSAATDSYRQTEVGEAGETPITTPSNSEYRFQTSNAGVVGGMVGMPGVLVGVQRTDSLTSSVQNNPSMSVRDDNIDEISDRDTLEDTAAFSEHPSRDIKQTEGRFEESSEGERLSSGVESFELVNAEEAKGIEIARSPPKATDVPTHPLAQSYRASELSSGSGSQPVEEFPSPKELDYDESSSDESDRNVALEDEFDDAKDNFPAQTQNSPEYDSGSDFNDLKPAVDEKSKVQDEFFDEDFDNLKLADDDHQEDIDHHSVSIDDHFTGADDFGGFSQQGVVPEFSGFANGAQGESDEWEQLFAGFGNATPVAKSQDPGIGGAGASHELAVQELVAMGFEKDGR
ncbi:hypothetical protein JCM33374_g4944 [Metschnikowia sp. JCM 33374]|nr:hypothetical protein JCM33374_g4944 [Metschnikowia sp. JCM 33374]